MAATCIVTGKIINGNGVAFENVQVRATPVVEGNGEILTPAGEVVSQEDVVTSTDQNGAFSIALLRGVRFIINIEASGYTRTKLIPDVSTIDIKDL
jgi:hypothetical protein